MDKQPYEYRTGSTHPPKNHRGLIAFLLICVIFLCGVVSLLGHLNIRLLSRLKQQGAVSFSQGGSQPEGADALSLTCAGMALQELPSLYQSLYDLPAGLYVSGVESGSAAAKAGISPGDVLLTVNGTAVTRLDALQSLLNQMNGYQLILTVYQDGQENTITLPLSD